MPALRPVQYRRISYSDLRTAARRSRGFGDDASNCVAPGTVGPLQAGQVYCDPSTLADLAWLNANAVNTQQQLTASLQANPLTYAPSSMIYAGKGCMTSSFPWIGNLDGNNVCQPSPWGGLIVVGVGLFFGMLALKAITR